MHKLEGVPNTLRIRALVIDVHLLQAREVGEDVAGGLLLAYVVRTELLLVLKRHLAVEDEGGLQEQLIVALGVLRVRDKAWRQRLRKKSDTFDVSKELKAMVEKQFDKFILCLHDDKGGEFIGIKWDAFFAQHSIWHKHTVKALAQQNGVAERLNRILEELLVAMLNGACLPTRFWGDGLNYLCHIIVRSLSSLIPAGTTLYEMVHKRKPDYLPLRVFGCRAWAHIQRKERKSLQDHGTPYIFLSCPEDFKGWKLWDPSANGSRSGMIVSRDVVWNEDEFPGLSRVAQDIIPERFGRPAEPGDAERSPVTLSAHQMKRRSPPRQIRRE
jgi:hypothetical protein